MVQEPASLRGTGMFMRLIGRLLLLLAATTASAQEFSFPQAAVTDDVALQRLIPSLAREVLAAYADEDRSRFLDNTFRLQLASGQHASAIAALDQWRELHASESRSITLSVGVELYARALALQAEGLSFENAWNKVLRELLSGLDDRAAYDVSWALGTSPTVLRQRLQPLRDRQRDRSALSMAEAISLVRSWLEYHAYRSFAPVLQPVIAEDEARRYITQNDVLIPTEHGATLSAVIVRSRHASKRPTALMSLMQTDPMFMSVRAKFAASRGYVGVVSDTRGKRLSPDDIVLFEHDAEDIHGVIDWISRQPWSDGQVGMYGGSNAGFTQWAAAKSAHPALKTIVPYCPLDPGFGLPMNNNIFLTANYDYLFMVGNTKYTDSKFSVPGRFNATIAEWYRSGRPYREIDQVDGHPNRYLQRFLRHPSYDAFWQGLTANGKDYRKLDIPILAIDGYYDDGQNNAIRRLQEHYRYRPGAEHYLVIGPYDHFDAQSSRKAPVLRNYRIDAAAQVDTQQLTFEWFDYVLKDGPKPALLRDRINYQVMGADVWRHAPSIEAMSGERITLFLSSDRAGPYYKLAPRAPKQQRGIKQVVDFADRDTTSFSYYPIEIVSSKLDLKAALAFISEPLEAPMSINGLFSAKLRAVINKKDMDVAMVLYEVTPSGQFFHLSYTVQRASYSRDMTRRRLLAPNRAQEIRLQNTLLVSRLLAKGSRLLVVLDINRGPQGQVNYGTGKDVSDESIADAKEPLVVEWMGESTVVIPMSREAT